MKRFLDVFLAGLGLLVTWPLMLIIVIVIRLTSEGPAIYVQDRIGRNEAVFRCLKFRTMTIRAGNVASHEASQSWVTPFGRFLRRTKLDELPQLLNVLHGEMSLVGPRPCLPSQEELIEARRLRGVFAVRPGITGAAQVAGIDMSDPYKLAEADYRYLQTRTLLGDLKLMFLTALGSGAGDALGRP